MDLRKEYFLKYGMPYNEDGMFYEEYVVWLENKFENIDNYEKPCEDLCGNCKIIDHRS